MSYYLSVQSRGSTLFEVFNRVGGISLTEAWNAALPALLKAERLPGVTRIVLRIDDEPVLD